MNVIEFLKSLGVFLNSLDSVIKAAVALVVSITVLVSVLYAVGWVPGLGNENTVDPTISTLECSEGQYLPYESVRDFREYLWSLSPVDRRVVIDNIYVGSSVCWGGNFEDFYRDEEKFTMVLLDKKDNDNIDVRVTMPSQWMNSVKGLKQGHWVTYEGDLQQITRTFFRVDGTKISSQ